MTTRGQRNEETGEGASEEAPRRSGSNGPRPDVDRLRLIIADPDPLARRAIRDSLRRDGGFLVSAEAKDGVEAIELAVHYRPELVLMEVALPGIDGIAACREISTRAPEVRVVMFSVPQQREIEIRALRAGATGSCRRTRASSRSRGRFARSRSARPRSRARSPRTWSSCFARRRRAGSGCGRSRAR